MKKQLVEKTQFEKFRDAAHEAGTDNSEEVFDAQLKRIAAAHSKSPKPDDAKAS